MVSTPTHKVVLFNGQSNNANMYGLSSYSVTGFTAVDMST